MTNKLAVCKKTRAVTARTLAVALRTLFRSKKPVSETSLRDAWLKQLRSQKELLEEGWYMPPPHGMCVLIGSADSKSRVNYDSLRPKKMWPRADIFLTKTKNMIYAYASPIDRDTGIIGDFGMSVYRGYDETVKKHLQNCMEINQEIFDSVTVGMRLMDVYKSAMKIIGSYGLTNNIVSVSDPASVNIGHTIPASYEDWTPDEDKLLKSKSARPQDIAQLISRKRKFVSPAEMLEVRPGMAFTIEPRMISKVKSGMPLSSYHAIILIDENGDKELLTNFEEIFKLAGMDYML